jgi:hypothetical protein
MLIKHLLKEAAAAAWPPVDQVAGDQAGAAGHHLPLLAQPQRTTAAEADGSPAGLHKEHIRVHQENNGPGFDISAEGLLGNI